MGNDLGRILVQVRNVPMSSENIIDLRGDLTVSKIKREVYITFNKLKVLLNNEDVVSASHINLQFKRKFSVKTILNKIPEEILKSYQAYEIKDYAGTREFILYQIGSNSLSSYRRACSIANSKSKEENFIKIL